MDVFYGQFGQLLITDPPGKRHTEMDVLLLISLDELTVFSKRLCHRKFSISPQSKLYGKDHSCVGSGVWDKDDVGSILAGEGFELCCDVAQLSPAVGRDQRNYGLCKLQW